jgi:hypothetical protein
MFALLCPIFSGCIESEIFTLARYDPKDDSVRCIQVYTNICAAQKADLDHLVSLWERRESIIIQPVELPGLPAFERKGKNKYCSIDLGELAKKQSEVTSTDVDLDSIKVIPGEFYLNAHLNLCYYHQIVVPGKTIDALLKEVIPFVTRELADFAKHQVELAGMKKAKIATWDELRKELVEELVVVEDVKNNPMKKNDEKKDEELTPLEMASLQMLIIAGKDKALQVSRNKEFITAIVPLSKKDCHELIATFDFVRKACDERIKSGKLVEPGVPEALEAFKLKYVDGSGLEVSADMTKLAKAMTALHAKDGKIDFDPAPSEEMKNVCKATVASVQGRAIAIKKSLSIKDVVAEFLGK